MIVPLKIVFLSHKLDIYNSGLLDLEFPRPNGGNLHIISLIDIVQLGNLPGQCNCETVTTQTDTNFYSHDKKYNYIGIYKCKGVGVKK